MTRKSSLTDTVNQYLNYDNQGTQKQRQLRRFVLNKIIDDFYCLRIVPPSWYGLTATHVEQLVQLWKKNGLQNATIMNYLVCFRSFLKKINHIIDGIENAHLDLVKSRNQKKPLLIRDEIQLQDPVAQILFSLQAYFGLTFHEALYLVPEVHIDNDALWITREISSNSKDRYIPIDAAIQKELIHKLNELTRGESIISQFGEAYSRLAYRYAIKKAGLSTNIHYRYLYAKARSSELKHLPRSIQVETIKKEMCITAASTLWSYLHE